MPEIFGKILSVIRLYAFNGILEECQRMFHKDCRRIAAVIRERFQIALPGILIYCGELI